MTSLTGLKVLKFGSSVLRCDEDLPRVAMQIATHTDRGAPLIVVVSALGDTTDRLQARAAALGMADARARASLLATGEEQAAALLTLALIRAGLRAVCAGPAELDLRAHGPREDAVPVSLDTVAVERLLDGARVLVVPGFVAVSTDGGPALLGRGGSDLTALFLAHALGATACRLVKDVDGLYERDPNRAAGTGAPPRRFASADWHDASRLAGSLVQARALRFARVVDREFEVGTLTATGATRIGSGPTRLDAGCSPRAESCEPRANATGERRGDEAAA